MLLCAQFPTSFQSNSRPLPEIFVKVESCRACDCALRSLGGRVSLGGGRLTLGGRTLTRRCFQSGLKGRRVNLTPEAVERGLKYSLSLCGEVTAKVGQSSPSTARKRCRIAEHASDFTFLLPGEGRTFPEFTCHSCRRNARSTE